MYANLCAGTGEAGKSTFIKQMRIIHGQGYSEGDRKKFTVLVYRNIYTASQILISAMEDLNIPYATKEAERSISALRDASADGAVNIPESDYRAIRSLWADDGVQKCFQRRREFQITDSAK